MNIRPLDLQVMLPRLTEVSKVQQVSLQQAELQLQHSAKDWQQMADMRQRSVQQSDRSAGGRIRREEEKNAHGGAHGQRQSESNQEQEESAGLPPEDGSGKGKIIDIRT